jgi:hypothetical protein
LWANGVGVVAAAPVARAAGVGVGVGVWRRVERRRRDGRRREKAMGLELGGGGIWNLLGVAEGMGERRVCAVRSPLPPDCWSGAER